jgi:SAM-dependent methyltransferase
MATTVDTPIQVTTTPVQIPFDQAKLEAFTGRALGDASATFVNILCVIGDRLGLFKDLARHGPATSAELAMRAGIQERYAREWLSALASAGYLEYDAADRRFRLPPEHAPVLAQESGPVFFGGVYHMIPALVGSLDRLTEAFRRGGGVSQADYDPRLWEGMERFTASWFENLLLQQWIPAAPEVQAALERGALLADVGCGRGRALIKLAQAFPRSRFVGYDLFEPVVRTAATNAQAAGVADRVRFEQRDISQGIPERYDVVTTFDVVHDAVDPLGMLRAIRHALRPDGTYLCLEFNCSDTLEENAGPIGAFLYSCSVLYCTTTSLAGGGEGLGTAGLPESRLRELGTAAGFSRIRRLPLENPFNTLYALQP